MVGEKICNEFLWLCDRIWSDPCDSSSNYIQMKYYLNHTSVDQFVIEHQNLQISCTVVIGQWTQHDTELGYFFILSFFGLRNFGWLEMFPAIYKVMEHV